MEKTLTAALDILVWSIAMRMSSIYLELVALRTVQLVNVEVLALTRAYRRSLQVVWAAVSAACDESLSYVTMYAEYVIATPLKCFRGSEYPRDDHGVSHLPKSTCH